MRKRAKYFKVEGGQIMPEAKETKEKPKRNEAKLFIYFWFLKLLKEKNPDQILTTGEICKLLGDKLGITNRRGIVKHLADMKNPKKLGILEYKKGSYGLPKDFESNPELIDKMDTICVDFGKPEHTEAFLKAFGTDKNLSDYEKANKSKDENEKAWYMSLLPRVEQYHTLLLSNKAKAYHIFFLQKKMENNMKKYSKEYEKITERQRVGRLINQLIDLKIASVVFYNNRNVVSTDIIHPFTLLKKCSKCNSLIVDDSYERKLHKDINYYISIAKDLLKSKNLSRRYRTILEFLLNHHKFYNLENNEKELKFFKKYAKE